MGHWRILRGDGRLIPVLVALLLHADVNHRVGQGLKTAEKLQNQIVLQQFFRFIRMFKLFIICKLLIQQKRHSFRLIVMELGRFIEGAHGPEKRGRFAPLLHRGKKTRLTRGSRSARCAVLVMRATKKNGKSMKLTPFHLLLRAFVQPKPYA